MTTLPEICMRYLKHSVTVAAVIFCAAACTSMKPATRASISVPAIARPAGETSAWWYRAGAAKAQQLGAGGDQARNIILFVGDGMSLPTVAAARIFQGQRSGMPGEENELSFEKFPHTALSKTYNTDSQTPDSAGTMSAMATGAKTRMGLISAGLETRRRQCSPGNVRLATVLELAEAAGLSTGIVTTTRLTHATPGASYAHSPERDWESDVPAAAAAAGCEDIARQFVGFSAGDGIDVALGGGRSPFTPSTAVDPEHAQVAGSRRDNRNLVSEWQKRFPDGRYVWNREQFDALDLHRTQRLLGLFEPGHMSYEHDRQADPAGEPSLAEMTRAAITVLARNPSGFFLLVEGGRIDHAHHAGNAYRALTETIAFSDAIAEAGRATSSDDTLILVTADHGHTLSFVGYPGRGNPILGKVRGSIDEEGTGELATDALGLPYTTLVYANGPGYVGATAQQAEGSKHFPHVFSAARVASGRPDLRQVDTGHPDYLQEAMMPSGSETHGGDDVGVWATGPGSAAVRGSIEQNVIFHLLVRSQPGIVRLLCRLGSCDNGVPVRLVSPDALKPAASR